jgi:hypothetical protein
MVSHGRPVERMASLAAVNLSTSAEFLDGFLLVRSGGETAAIIVIPALEVADAQLSLGVFLVTGPLARFLFFDFESHGDLRAVRSRVS